MGITSGGGVGFSTGRPSKEQVQWLEIPWPSDAAANFQEAFAANDKPTEINSVCLADFQYMVKHKMTVIIRIGILFQ